MNKKTYIFKNVTYIFNGKWQFVATVPNGTVTLISECPGGAPTAHKIARQVAGAVARKGELDNLARVTIDKIKADAVNDYAEELAA